VSLCIGILKTIFDGIQRPLETIARESGSVFVPRGVDVPSLDQHKLWDFTPHQWQIGDQVVGGDVLGRTFETDLFPKHKIMVPPRVSGRIVEMQPAD
jgi:V-type H+-transporting ATPase subunit A